MLGTMKVKAMTAKNTASEAFAAAGAAVMKGLSTAKDKGCEDEASLQIPLVAEAAEPSGFEDAASVSTPLVAEAAEPSSGGLDSKAFQEKLAMAGAVAKSGVDKVKHKCDVAAIEFAERLLAAGSAAKLSAGTVKGKCENGVVAVKSKLDVVKQQLPSATPLLSVIESECVELVVSMGFPRRDAVRAVRKVGTEDVNSVVAFLCQEQGPRAAAPEWTAHMNQCIARRILEMQLDEEEDVRIALALSQFQYEASQSHGHNLPEASPFAPFHCWENGECPNQQCTHVTGVVCHTVYPSTTPQPFQLRPSVGTWLQPLPKPLQCEHNGLSNGAISSESDSIAPCTDMEQKVVELKSLVSSRPGAVRCGA